MPKGSQIRVTRRRSGNELFNILLLPAVEFAAELTGYRFEVHEIAEASTRAFPITPTDRSTCTTAYTVITLQ